MPWLYRRCRGISATRRPAKLTSIICTLDALDALQRDHPDLPPAAAAAFAEQIRRATRAGIYGAMGVSFDG